MPPDGNIHHGEIIAPQRSVEVSAAYHPLRVDRRHFDLPQGLSIGQIIEIVQPNRQLRAFAHVHIGDVYVPREWWYHVRPKPGALVSIRIVPGKGGGGKNPVATLLTIAVIAASFYFGGALGAELGLSTEALFSFEIAGVTIAPSVASIVGGAIISTVGNLIVSAIAPPPKQGGLSDATGFGAPNLSPTQLTITGTSNKYNRYGVVPRVFGRIKVFPVYAAVPFTEAEGNDQYVRLLFDFGYGPLQLSEHMIGTTPIEQFDGVEMEVRQGYSNDAAITLYSNTVQEDPYSLRITNADGPVIRQSRINADEVSLDLAFNGLVQFSADGSRSERTVNITIEYRLVGAVGWTLLTTEDITGSTEQTVRKGYRFKPATKGQYQVRITRNTADNTSTQIRDVMFLTVIRTIIYTAPVNLTGHCLVAMRLKATNQLNGVVQEYSALAEALLPIWNGSSFNAPAVTRSPTWAALEVLRGAANKRALANSRIDLQSFIDHAAFCATLDQNGEAMYLYDAVFDTETSVMSAANAILATARASLRPKDGKWSIIWDRAQSTVVQYFSPRNSWGFKAKKLFLDVPHAIRGQFVNPDLDWRQDERIIYADGYNESTATVFEAIEMRGVTRASQVWRDGRFHQAQAKLRPEVYELNADIESIVCTRGSLVRAAHDVPRWGLRTARIKSVVEAASAITSITVDDTFEMTAGIDYCIRVRLSDGSSVYALITTVAGSNTTITPRTPISGDVLPAVDDLIFFGVAELESSLFLVQGIQRGPNLTAKILMVDYSPAVYTADQGTIPAFSTNSTFPEPQVFEVPPPPYVTRIDSDEDVLFRLGDGTLVPRILVDFDFSPAGRVLPEFVEGQIRRSGTGEDWRNTAPVGAQTKTINFVDVVEGQTYEMRLRSLSRGGRPSDWVTVDTTTVIGQSTVPPDVASMVLNGTKLQWLYPDAPLDLAGFNIYYKSGASRSLLGATKINDDPVKATSFDVGNSVIAGATSLMVTAVDRGGRESETPAVVVANLGDMITGNIVATYDYQANSYPGTITGGSIVGGNIEGDTTVDPMFWGANETAFWNVSESSDFWPAITYAELIYEFSYTPLIENVPGALTLDVAVDAEQWELLYRHRGRGPFWASGSGAPVWGASGDDFWPDQSDWAPWPGVLDNCGRETVDFKIDCPSSTAQQPVISDCVITLDVPDIEEVLLDQAIGSSGSRLPITETYRVIKDVNLTLLYDGGSAVGARAVDKNATLGPLIETINGSNVGVTGHVNATIKGY